MVPHQMGKQSVAGMRPKSAETSVAHSPERVTASFQSSLLLPVFLPENPMDRGAWQATVHGVE